MTDHFVLDLDAETGTYEVAVFCYLDGQGKQEPDWHDRCTYSVDIDRGHGRLTVYETTSQDKAVGVAEYLEAFNRLGQAKDGKVFTRSGEPFNGKVWHWDH